MQDFQSIPGLAARLFGGAAAAADLRRGAQCGGPAAAAEAVKCPRCESTNTKFCYYNNYNLSQPRHFCKSCRRYWTKGGVLRNVPVGGGCRKPKRSSASSAASTSASSSAGDAKSNRRASASASRSSSGSSSPTAAAATATASATSSSSTVTVTTQPTSSTVTNLNPNPSVAEVVLPPAPIFADQGASVFTSLLAPPPQLPVFNFSAQPKTEEVASVFAEHTAAAAGTATIAADMTPFSVRLGGAVMAGVDWAPASLDSGIFELTGGIGDTSPAYWNPATWADVPDPTIYLP